MRLLVVRFERRRGRRAVAGDVASSVANGIVKAFLAFAFLAFAFWFVMQSVAGRV